MMAWARFHSLLLLPVCFHDWQRYSAVGPADNQLQLWSGQASSSGTGRASCRDLCRLVQRSGYGGFCRLSRPNDCAISRRRFRCSGHCSEWISAICCCLCVFVFNLTAIGFSGCRESVGRYSVCTVARIGFYGSEFPATSRNYRDERYLAGFRIERGVDFGMHPRLLSSRKA